MELPCHGSQGATLGEKENAPRDGQRAEREGVTMSERQRGIIVLQKAGAKCRLCGERKAYPRNQSDDEVICLACGQYYTADAALLAEAHACKRTVLDAFAREAERRQRLAEAERQRR